MKKKWSVTAVVTGSKHIGTFMAETGEKAIQMAYDSDTCDVSFCHQCDTECEDPQIGSLVASSGDDVVDEHESWQDRARAAGWTPPKKGPKKAKEKKS